MEEYYFLFVLAFIFVLFAAVQDLKKREVANWLNFSLLGFALAYRAFYAVYQNDWNFLAFGLVGFFIFYVLGNILYYAKMFGGGDVKLLWALGAVLPYSKYTDLIFVSIEFIILLFLVGAVYTLIYSIFLVCANKKKFKEEFDKQFKTWKVSFLFSFFISVLLLYVINSRGLWLTCFILLFVLPLLFIYLKSLDKTMIKLVKSSELTEGDWLEQDVKVGNRWIRKTVHGLSMRDILLLKRNKKKVLIKYGVPYVPAFLISFVIMVFFYLVLRAFPFLVFL